MLVIGPYSETNHAERDAVMADVLSPFKVHGFLAEKVARALVSVSLGRFCRGLSGHLRQFGKRMVPDQAVSYRVF